ncbi:hypothetical protein D6C87_09731 [Aureobasidium pullulans]|nr:hypothetical protein D6C87_09731 [Aureobasidium pullulans]
MRSTWYIFLRPTTTLEPSGIETYIKSVGGIHTNTPQTPEEKAAELAAFDQELYRVQLAMNESMWLVAWREDRVHVAPVTDTNHSISRAAPITPLDVHYCLPDLREEATTSLPKVNLTADSDVVYINTTVTGGLICHQSFQDAHILDTGVIYNDTTVTGTFMGHQIFEDVYNRVIRQELLVVRVPEMAHRRVKEIDLVVRVPVLDHLGPWKSPYLVFEKVASFDQNVIELYLVGPCAPSPTRSPSLFMHGITEAEDHEQIIPKIFNALQDKNLKQPCISFALEVQMNVIAAAFNPLRVLTSLKRLTSLQITDASRVAPNAGSSQPYNLHQTQHFLYLIDADLAVHSELHRIFSTKVG